MIAMKLIKLKCKKCKNIASSEKLVNIGIACESACIGIIELIVDESGRVVRKRIELRGVAPLPAPGLTTFTCPISLSNPAKSELVEVIEERTL